LSNILIFCGFVFGGKAILKKQSRFLRRSSSW